MKERIKESNYEDLIKALDWIIFVLKKPKNVPPATIPKLIAEIDQLLQGFDRSKLDANMQGKLLKKTGWYRTQLDIARRKKKTKGI